ncbi:MAG: hypothetical protein WCS71_02865 [Sphaerochaetaceae bacterium]
MRVLAISKGGAYIELPQPSFGGYTTQTQEIVKASRNALGNLYKFRINTKKTIEVQWSGFTAEEKNLIWSLTSDNSFNVRYLDVEDDQVKYGKFYRGNDSKVSPMLTLRGQRFDLYEIKMTLVEL